MRVRTSPLRCRSRSCSEVCCTSPFGLSRGSRCTLTSRRTSGYRAWSSRAGARVPVLPPWCGGSDRWRKLGRGWAMPCAHVSVVEAARGEPKNFLRRFRGGSRGGRRSEGLEKIFNPGRKVSSEPRRAASLGRDQVARPFRARRDVRNVHAATGVGIRARLFHRLPLHVRWE